MTLKSYLTWGENDNTVTKALNLYVGWIWSPAFYLVPWARGDSWVQSRKYPLNTAWCGFKTKQTNKKVAWWFQYPDRFGSIYYPLCIRIHYQFLFQEHYKKPWDSWIIDIGIQYWQKLILFEQNELTMWVRASCVLGTWRAGFLALKGKKKQRREVNITAVEHRTALPGSMSSSWRPIIGFDQRALRIYTKISQQIRWCDKKENSPILKFRWHNERK